MEHYRCITARENRRRRERLEDFRARLLWCGRSRRGKSRGAESPTDEEIAHERRALAEALPEVREAVAAAGVPASRRWHPPLSSGHDPGVIDVLGDLLELEWYQAVHDWAIHILDDAIGLYRRDARPARQRTLSPAWWLRRGARRLGRIASRTLDAAGLHPARSRASQLRSAILVLCALFGGAASVLAILDRLH